MRNDVTWSIFATGHTVLSAVHITAVISIGLTSFVVIVTSPKPSTSMQCFVTLTRRSYKHDVAS